MLQQADPNNPNLVQRLLMQASCPFEDAIEAEKFYAILKEIITKASPKSFITGQINRPLEMCCGDKIGPSPFARVTSPNPPGPTT